MNVLKHGSKLVSVGLLSLSLSAGFSGLTFAHTLLPPSPSTATTTPTTTSFPGQFTGTTTPGQFNKTTPGQFNRTTPGQFNRTTPGQSGEALEGANETSSYKSSKPSYGSNKSA